MALIVTLDGVLKATAGQMCVPRGRPGLRILQDQINELDKVHRMNQTGTLRSYFGHPLGLSLNIEKTSIDFN